MQEYTTGNSTVDAVGTMQFAGNIIPQTWYRTITRDNGKPYLLAIAILADIVYWYRPAEIRDEISGKLIRYQKRFKQDLLQRSYDQLAEMLGESKRSVTDAVVRLEKLGIVERIFRTVESGGVKCANVLFLKLNADALYQVTFPEKGRELSEIKEQPDNQEEVSQNSEEGVPKQRGGSPEKTGHLSQNKETPIARKRETNTEITTETITEIKSSSDDELKKQVGYQNALRKYPEELVESVFRELRKRDDELQRIITSPMFATVCENISEFSGKINNQPAYIAKCLDNMLQSQKTPSYAVKRVNSVKNSFNQFQQNNYDFEELERKLISNV